MRVSTDFDKDPAWEKVPNREHCYRRKNTGNENNDRVNGHISVNGTSIFTGDKEIINGVQNNNGLQFTAYAGHYSTSGNNEYATLEVSPREYRIYMNNVGTTDSKDKCLLTVDHVPANYYIWIEALPTNSGGGRFALEKNSSDGSWTRVDGQNDTSGKHLFCYKVDTNGTYVISPYGQGACYLYYVAVMDHPCPIVTFNTSQITLSPSGTSRNTADVAVYTDDYSTSYPYRPNISKEFLEYSSDDETVVTVDQDGTIKAVGKGEATITATLKAGAEFRTSYYGTTTYTLERACTASYKVIVNDNRVVSSAVSNGSHKTLWDEVSLDGYVKLYLGGWKYQSESAFAPNKNYSDYNIYNKTISDYTYGNGTKKTDYWEDAKPYEVGNELPIDYQAEPIDGYEYYNLGKENGKCEFLYTNKLLAGDYDLEFKERNPNIDDDDITSKDEKTNQEEKVKGKGNPFTVPCFGSFLKIEPQSNGLLTVYILQNGNLEFDSNHDNHLIGRLGWRPVYIVDEAGNRLLSDDVKAVTKQRTMVSYNDDTADVYETDGVTLMTDAVYTEVVKNYVDDTTKEWIYGRHKTAFDNYWGRRGSSEIVLDPTITGDGWVVMTKAYVKYQFEVKAGKSYYVFANKSAIGYCGASFLPYTQSTKTYTLKEGEAMPAELKTELANSGSVTAKSVTVNHKFHAGWNSICLPFSITESKMRKIFGSATVTAGNLLNQKKEDYELVMYNGATFDKEDSNYDNVHFFHHVYQDIIAGYPYMIYIPSGASVVQNGVTSFTVDDVTIENVDRPTITTSRQYMPNDSGFENHAENSHFTFTGVYDPTSIPEGSYCVVKEGIQIYHETTLPGYRAYLRPTYKSDPAYANEIRRITATNLNELTYIWDEANPIESIFADVTSDNEFSAPSNVYSVSGQLIRQNSTSLEGLPKGIYIVNGKKYFVK